MDPQTDLPDLVEDLEVHIDELTSTLTPLLPPQTLQKTSASLPLLEKAKLHVLAAYSIESLLFSTLLASGADAKSHALFAELARLKGYFAKIKDAEAHMGREEKRARLDVGAAQRFIKHGLAGNERYDEMRRERVEREKERAVEKARTLTNRKFDDDDDESAGRKRGAQSEEEEEEEEEGTPAKKSKLTPPTADTHIPAPAPTASKKSRRTKQPADADTQDEDEDEETAVDPPVPARKKRGRPSKKARAEISTSTPTSTPRKAEEAATSTPARATRSSAPKTRSEAFTALAAGSPASASKGKGKGKGKGRGKEK